MANYGILVTDNGDGTFSIGACNRGTTTSSFTGGTDITTNTYTVNAATGALTSASGFKDAATDTGDGLGHKMRSPMEVIQRCIVLINMDRGINS